MGHEVNYPITNGLTTLHHIEALFQAKLLVIVTGRFIKMAVRVKGWFPGGTLKIYICFFQACRTAFSIKQFNFQNRPLVSLAMNTLGPKIEILFKNVLLSIY